MAVEPDSVMHGSTRPNIPTPSATVTYILGGHAAAHAVTPGINSSSISYIQPVNYTRKSTLAYRIHIINNTQGQVGHSETGMNTRTHLVALFAVGSWPRSMTSCTLSAATKAAFSTPYSPECVAALSWASARLPYSCRASGVVTWWQQ